MYTQEISCTYIHVHVVSLSSEQKQTSIDIATLIYLDLQEFAVYTLAMYYAIYDCEELINTSDRRLYNSSTLVLGGMYNSSTLVLGVNNHLLGIVQLFNTGANFNTSPSEAT